MEERFEKHKEFLVDRMDPDFGLIDKLLSSKILTREAMHRIKLKDNTTEDKNKILLDFILKNKKMNELISALGDSGQIHLVNYLNADGDDGSAFGDDWPLGDSETDRLCVNHENLVEILDTSDLCNRLFSEKVINNRQKQLISSKPTDAEKNQALLDILIKFSRRQYKKTIDCLHDSKQSHIAKLLSEGGVVVRVHVNIEDAVGNVDELEKEIISQITKVLENQPLNEATRLLDLTKLGIIAATKGHSIVIYMYCMTHDELLQLTDLLKTDKLNGIIEKVFTEMLLVGNALRVTLTWSLEEFKKASTYFDSGDVSLRGDLQSKLTVTERPSLSNTLVEDSRHAGWMQESSYRPKPLGKICGCDATTQTDEESFMKKKTDWIPAEVEEATSESIILCSAGTQTERQHEEKDTVVYERQRGEDKFVIKCCNKECLDLKQKLEQTLKERDRLIKMLKEQRSKGSHEGCKALEETVEQEKTEKNKQIKLPVYQRQEGSHEGCKALELTVEQEKTEKNKQIKRPEVELRREYNLDTVLDQKIGTKSTEKEKKWVHDLTFPYRNLSEELPEVDDYKLMRFFDRPCNLNELDDPDDIGFRNRNKYHYIWDNERLNDQSSEMWMVDPTGKLINSWQIGDNYNYLCVADASNVILNRRCVPGPTSCQADDDQKDDGSLTELQTDNDDAVKDEDEDSDDDDDDNEYDSD